MATVTGTSTLTLSAAMVTVTGFVDIKQGLLDNVTNSIKPLSKNTWAALKGSSWATYTSYAQNPLPIIWTSDLQDLGDVRYFNLEILTILSGNVQSFTIYTSESGLFSGEETITKIEDGDYDIPAFYGRYFYVQVTATATEITDMTITASSTVSTIRLNNVDSSTLSGTNTARVIPLAYPVSEIMDIDIKVKATTPYAVNLYVSDSATSKIAIPVVVSKTATNPTFALYGIDNDPRDATVDITLTCLPRQVMGGSNIYIVA